MLLYIVVSCETSSRYMYILCMYPDIFCIYVNATSKYPVVKILVSLAAKILCSKIVVLVMTFILTIVLFLLRITF